MTEITEPVGSPVIRSRRPPGPRGLKLISTLFDYNRRTLATLEKLIVDYGDVVYFPLPPVGAFFLGHPDLIQQVLIKNADNYHKTNANPWAKHFFGNAMQINNGDYARNLRRMVAPAFHGESIARAYGELVVRETSAVVGAWKPGHHPQMTQEVSDIVLDVVVQIFFGTKPGAETKRLGGMFLASVAPAGALLPAWVPRSRNHKYVRAAAALTAEVIERIQAERRHNTGGSDFLSILVRVGGQGLGLTDQQIRDEVVPYALAGHASAMAVMQILRFIGENPAIEETLAAELATVLGDRDPGIRDLPNLVYLDRVIKETLRLAPPAGLMFRRAMADDVIGGWPIPAGAKMFVSSWVVQRDGRFFDQPLEFKPERWTPEFERALSMCAYFPFGRGPRSCIGGAMGELILQLVVATICRRYRLEALRKLPPEQAEWPSVLAAGGVQLNVHPRPA